MRWKSAKKSRTEAGIKNNLRDLQNKEIALREKEKLLLKKEKVLQQKELKFNYRRSSQALCLRANAKTNKKLHSINNSPKISSTSINTSETSSRDQSSEGSFELRKKTRKQNEYQYQASQNKNDKNVKRNVIDQDESFVNRMFRPSACMIDATLDADWCLNTINRFFRRKGLSRSRKSVPAASIASSSSSETVSVYASPIVSHLNTAICAYSVSESKWQSVNKLYGKSDSETCASQYTNSFSECPAEVTNIPSLMIPRAEPLCCDPYQSTEETTCEPARLSSTSRDRQTPLKHSDCDFTSSGCLPAVDCLCHSNTTSCECQSESEITCSSCCQNPCQCANILDSNKLKSINDPNDRLDQTAVHKIPAASSHQHIMTDAPTPIPEQHQIKTESNLMHEPQQETEDIKSIRESQQMIEPLKSIHEPQQKMEEPNSIVESRETVKDYIKSTFYEPLLMTTHKSPQMTIELKSDHESQQILKESKPFYVPEQMMEESKTIQESQQETIKKTELIREPKQIVKSAKSIEPQQMKEESKSIQESQQETIKNSELIRESKQIMKSSKSIREPQQMKEEAKSIQESQQETIKNSELIRESKQIMKSSKSIREPQQMKEEAKSIQESQQETIKKSELIREPKQIMKSSKSIREPQQMKEESKSIQESQQGTIKKSELTRESKQIMKSSKSIREPQQMKEELKTTRVSKQMMKESESIHQPQQIMKETKSIRESQPIIKGSKTFRESLQMMKESKSIREAQQMMKESKSYRESLQMMKESKSIREAQQMMKEPKTIPITYKNKKIKEVGNKTKKDKPDGLNSLICECNKSKVASIKCKCQIKMGKGAENSIKQFPCDCVLKHKSDEISKNQKGTYKYLPEKKLKVPSNYALQKKKKKSNRTKPCQCSHRKSKILKNTQSYKARKSRQVETDDEDEPRTRALATQPPMACGDWMRLNNSSMFAKPKGTVCTQVGNLKHCFFKKVNKHSKWLVKVLMASVVLCFPCLICLGLGLICCCSCSKF